ELGIITSQAARRCLYSTYTRENPHAPHSRDHVLQAWEGTALGRDVPRDGEAERQGWHAEDACHDRRLRRPVLDARGRDGGGEHGRVRADDARRWPEQRSHEGIREHIEGVSRSRRRRSARDL